MTSPYEGNGEISVRDALASIKAIAEVQGKDVKKLDKQVADIWKKYDFGKLNKKAIITRGQYAAVVDEILNPFDAREVSITGDFIN